MARRSDAICCIRELRTGWGFSGDERLLLDAELVTLQRGDRCAAWSRTTQLLCHGAVVWPPRRAGRDRSDFGPLAADWLLTGSPARWRLRPGGLPDQDVERVWGDFIAARLSHGVGTDVLDDLFPGAPQPGTHVRVVVRAVEERASRIPFETFTWPRGTDQSSVLRSETHPISLLRVVGELSPDAPLHVVSLGAKQPGHYAPAVLNAPAADAPDGLGEIHKRVGSGELAGGSQIARPRVVERFTSFGDDALAAVAAADLAIVAGHATHAGALDVGGGMSLSGSDLAKGLAHGPPVAILAVCGSAVREDPPSPGLSMVESVARAGVGLSIGFQGDRTWTEHAASFVGRLTSELRPALEGLARAPDLLDWELAIAAARGTNSDAVAAVAYAHPALLAAGEQGRGATARRRARLGRASAEPWYVPGQVVVLPAPDRAGAALRLPLPVSVGAQINVELTRGGECSSEGSAVGAPELTELHEIWGLGSDRPIRVTIEHSDRPAPRQWARGSAELSAVLRALRTITGWPIPPLAFDMLHAAVANDWGAPDAVARLLDVDTGVPVRRVGSWPGLVVGQALPTRPMPSPRDAPRLLVDDAWRRFARPFDADVVFELLGEQSMRAARAPESVPAEIRSLMRIIQEEGAVGVVVPAGAKILRAGGRPGRAAWRVGTDGGDDEVY